MAILTLVFAVASWKKKLKKHGMASTQYWLVYWYAYVWIDNMDLLNGLIDVRGRAREREREI